MEFDLRGELHGVHGGGDSFTADADLPFVGGRSGQDVRANVQEINKKCKDSIAPAAHLLS